VKTFEDAHDEAVILISLTRNDKEIISGSYDKSLKIWSLGEKGNFQIQKEFASPEKKREYWANRSVMLKA